MCGEKRHLSSISPFEIGSPPRVRGKASGSWKCFCAMGITPACAGKRTQYFPACSCIWDHPRVCGEKSFGDVVALDAIGSPPRVRGKVAICPACSASSGITPACAGKSPASCHWPTVQRDHPRVCGEKNSIFCPVFSVTGSPPRVRGKAPRPSPSRPSRRITPACAGKRPRFLWQPGRLWDHPRVCGEKGGAPWLRH